MTDDVYHQGILVSKATKALILLHGRGGTARDILSLADAFVDDQFYIAAPQAPNSLWYPQSFMADENLNEPYLSLSIERIKKLIDETEKYIPKSQIYLMGFSQGACLALEISTRFAAKYGGIIAFTGGLIGSAIDEKKYQGNFDGTRVFVSNGDLDPYIPLSRSIESKEVMGKFGAEVTLKVYQGRPHTISEDEIDWVKLNLFR